MNAPIIVVLAAEKGSKKERWTHGSIARKQWLEIKGEPILARTLRLLSEFGCDVPYLITDSDEFAALPAISWCPLERQTKAHSVWAAEAIWGDRDLIVLYSDVYYTEAALRMILSAGSSKFLGRSHRSAYSFKNYGELFAIRINVKDKGKALAALEVAVQIYEATGDQSFWTFCRLFSGVDPSAGMDTPYFLSIHDETDDIDFPEEYERLVAALEKRPVWWMRYFLRRLSMLNKRRRDHRRRKRMRRSNDG